jgi:hypothetical protein
MGIVAEGSDKLLQVMMVSTVLHDLSGEGMQLLLRWELAVDQQKADLQESGPISQLLNRIATVLKDTLITVDVGDLGDAAHGVHVGGVIRPSDSASLALDIAQVCRVDRAILNSQLVGLACTTMMLNISYLYGCQEQSKSSSSRQPV